MQNIKITVLYTTLALYCPLNAKMLLKKSTKDNIFFTKCLFYYFKVLGIAPMSLYTNTPTKNNASHCLTFTPSKRALVYNVILISILTMSNVYRIAYLYISDTQSEFEAVTNCLQDIMLCFAALIILTKCCFSREKMIAIVNAIGRLSEFLEGFGVKNPKKQKLQFEIRMVLLANIAIWILLIVVTTVDDVAFMLYHTIYIMYANLIVVNALLIQYSVILKFLRYNFEMLNDNLLEYSREESIKIQSSIESNRKVEKLLQLRKLHASMSEVSRDVSNYYSYSTLGCIVYIFYALILTCYYIVQPIVLHEKSLKGITFINCCIYGLLMVFSIVVLTKSVTATIDESNRTKEIINANWLKFEDDEKMSKKLNRFSCYLLHTDIKFTVSGLFSLDDSLLTSMAGSITTYMVIVLQFQQK